MFSIMLEEINAISSVEAGVALVKQWVGMPAAVVPDAAGGSSGTQNCSLIAEFVARRYTNKRVAWPTAMSALGKSTNVLDAKTGELPFKSDGVYYLAAYLSAAGHELCVIREKNYTALMHAWAGHFEVFPRLNTGFTYNVHGPTDDGETRVYRALTAGIKINGTSPTMPTSWKWVQV